MQPHLIRENAKVMDPYMHWPKAHQDSRQPMPWQDFIDRRTNMTAERTAHLIKDYFRADESISDLPFSGMWYERPRTPSQLKTSAGEVEDKSSESSEVEDGDVFHVFGSGDETEPEPVWPKKDRGPRTPSRVDHLI